MLSCGQLAGRRPAAPLLRTFFSASQPATMAAVRAANVPVAREPGPGPLPAPRSVEELRQAFTGFFSRHASFPHQALDSAPLAAPGIAGDDSLLFTAAGMAPLKDYFLGSKSPPWPYATSIQRCLRAGGKNSDLDNVGHTPRHHTFFEMLGNFSFGRFAGASPGAWPHGPYFKREACQLAWTFLTEEVGLPADRLMVTVLHGDEDTRAVWRDVIGVPDDRIRFRDRDDNFWSTGVSGGPCGPCTEIHWDLAEMTPQHLLASEGEDARWLEIWNLVFMQYVLGPEPAGRGPVRPGEFAPLAAPCVDTGMGLERLASVVQGVASNFDTDELRAICLATADLVRGDGLAGSSTSSDDLAASPLVRVIADHSRALLQLLSESILPSNIGRGYITRRIARRAVLAGRQLGLQRPFLAELLPVVARSSAAADRARLAAALPAASAIITMEERAFAEVLDRAVRTLDAHLRQPGFTGTLGAEAIFRLYDTHGLPIDTTADLCRERGIPADLDGAQALLAESRLANRQLHLAADAAGGVDSAVATAAGAGPGSGLPRLGSVLKGWAASRAVSTFVGDTPMLKGPVATTVVAAGVAALDSLDDAVAGLREEVSQRLRALGHPEANSVIVLALDKCPFYARGGGQVGDIGTICLAERPEPLPVLDCLPAGEHLSFLLVAHPADLTDAHIASLTGEAVLAEVDMNARRATAANHTATHVLNAALRHVLGPHVSQAASRVEPDRLRFDFTHLDRMTDAQLLEVEAFCQSVADAQLPVSLATMNQDEALASGAIGLFTDKYAQTVRVVSVGDVSTELCGGTHAAHTGDLSPFILLGGDVSTARGIRRLEACAGPSAIRQLMAMRRDQQALLRRLDAPGTGEALDKIDRLEASATDHRAGLRRLRRQVEGLLPQLEVSTRVEVPTTADGQTGAPIRLHLIRLPEDLADEAATRGRILAAGADLAGDMDVDVVAVLGAGGLHVVVLRPTDRPDLNAGALVRAWAGKVGGRGGGRAAQAQAQLPAGLTADLAASRIFGL
ncbi:hypothetical protein H696_04475 [Fonticula alba]|uniref:Alanine--tRNA ligase n=1 Tax=Fonticula alba TaxID=691883 RepID=A0A058Z4L8_FONAL|nr:hypothetical protein H696_04475 [Fonticula alba]KCV69056.1 hypothetical protein H696_04475 [Fonticula alba]|eukprot:XP_009496627.1 hypothetical protein H696_04475 [Fonticula alba]